MEHQRTTRGAAVALALAGMLAGCSADAPAPQEHEHDHTAEARSALFSNGDFESGTNNQPPPSWTVTSLLNPGVTIQTPQTRAGLNLTPTIAGHAAPVALTRTLVTAAGPESQPDATLGLTASLRWPKFGNAVAIVNQQGQNQNVNSMKQTMTVGSADIDPIDGLAHIRFVLAPVLQDPGHTADQQPYFFVQLTNLSKGNAVLYQDFNFANQPGVPWKQNAAGTVKYTDWTLEDIAPGSALLAPGDMVELEIIGAGCSLGGHWGQVYVDGIGATVPGLYVSGTGPSAANQNTDITYTLTYKNGSALPAAGVFVDFNTPPNTTFTSFSAPGLVCTAPAMGATGLVHCTIGALPAGGSGSFTVTVHINNGTAGSVITAGNYDIASTTTSPLLGPKIYTNVTNGVTYADLSITKSDSVAAAAAGSMVTYSIQVNNAGPNAVTGATVSDPLPAGLINASWTCMASAGASCTATGTGSINDSATAIPVGGKLTYTLTATIDPNTPAGQLANLATVKVPAAAVDPSSINNAAADYDHVTVANGVACPSGAVDCTSGVCDAKDGNCGYVNGDGPCTTANGGTVCRSGVCSANAGVCIPAGGCGADADCASNQWCNTQTFTCTPKLPNGQPIPTVSGHTPPLTGACTTGAGSAVCVSAVCDTNDSLCGYANGDGPCDMTNAATVCRSGACSADGTCVQMGGCNVDADCAAGWCNISVHTCSPKVGNGGVMPSDPGHAAPVLNAKCTDPAAALVCVSAVCDTADDKCGYANGDGTCDMTSGTKVCRSGACDPDGKCGYANGDGPCIPGNGTVCRSGACSPHGSVCIPVGGCAVDADCGAGEWCNTQVFACTPKLPNGTSMPTVSGHNPTLDGKCSAGAGAAVCASGVCDTADDKCGYADGDGPCTSATGPVVCRSSSCSTTGVCQEPTACTADSDCNTTSEYCDTGAHVCAPKLPNGQPMPTVSGHTPDLDGKCSTTEAPVVCISGVCDTADDKCGYANGDGPCTQNNAGVVCRSSTCSPSGGVCIPSGGCAVDADCASTEWCNTQTFTCATKLTNGTPVPSVNGHTPTLDGTCTAGAGSAVCLSAVCDTADNKCGYANGDGPCTMANGATVCRSGICGAGGTCVAAPPCDFDTDCNTATQYCDTGVHFCAPKLQNGAPLPAVPGHSPTLDGTCTDTSAQIVCVSGVCDTADNSCGHAIGKGPCDGTNGTVVCRSQVCATMGPNAGLCAECVVDNQCSGAQPVCDPMKNLCVQCTPAEASACVGSTPVCEAGADICAPCDGDFGSGTPDACGMASEPYCFLTGPKVGECGKCGSDADCVGHGGDTCDTTSGACVSACTKDSDCDSMSWCNAPAGGKGMCVPKLDNGQQLPGTPPDVKTCTTAVGMRVCKSGVCDKADDTCGYKNGDGPCTDAIQCRSGVCDTKDMKCGFADGDGPCTSDAVCRGTTCNALSQVCGKPGCKKDSDCPEGDYCKADGTCSPKLPDGSACSGANQCMSGACDEKVCDGVVASGNGATCAAQPGPSEGSGMAALGLMLAATALARRRRR